ncbi:DEAD/DEAH box helicase [Brevirhabdus sp.]|uniref:DEAD/DEAH box helicase n=1 Tax=Brevirhabdus sp. TaxID=2004514 RepID=UPI00405A0140
MIPTLSAALENRGYSTLTQVQQAVADPALTQADLLVSAQTGSGKTVAFGLAIAPTILDGAERFEAPANPLALIIAPTRELALQVARELGWLYAQTGAVVTTCVGGMDMRDERRALSRGAHLVVGTPGRLRDHIERSSLDMSDLAAVVLDEADEMLDLGFREDLELILGAAPESRRTLMFSATVPKSIAALSKSYLRDAVRITTQAEQSQHVDIEYRAFSVASPDPEKAIINLLRFYEAENALVFCNTRAMVNRLTSRFSNRGFAVVALSGELSQAERSHALQAMRDGRARVCVATDVAARGIDLPNLELVIHAELPSNSETLLHRSGRTGRAGRKGVSALVVPMKGRNKADRLLKFAKIDAEWSAPPSAEEVLQRDEERFLSDPLWTDAQTKREAALAATLGRTFDADQLALACARLFARGRSAPEELAAPSASPKGERREFGPSKWFSLSVGQNDRAEARWILPMICRAADISRDDIGAIRVRDSETFVELSQDAAMPLIAGMGEAMELERGAVLRPLANAPDLGPERPKRDRPASGPAGKPAKPKGKWSPDKGPQDRNDAPFKPAPSGKEGFVKKPYDKKKDAYKKGAEDPKGPRKEFGGKPRGDAKPDWKKKKHDGAGDFAERPARPRKDAAERVPDATTSAPKAAPKTAPKTGTAPSGRDWTRTDVGRKSPAARPERAGGKPYGKDKPGEGGFKARKAEGGKPGFKPKGKPGGPAKGKPGGFSKPGGKGGSAVPRKRPRD